MLKFIIIVFISYLIGLLVVTIIANILGLTDHSITKLEPDCHIIYYTSDRIFVNPCTGAIIP